MADLQSDPEPDSQEDEAYDSDFDDSSTKSLDLTECYSVTENGRTYHKFDGAEYYLPADIQEQDRLDCQHELFLRTLDGKLTTCPTEEGELQWVLDAGTGTGFWALAFADEHPEAVVLGVDLSPIQPVDVPPNLEFQLDNLEEEWNFRNQFDFVHMRDLQFGISDWPRLYAQTFKFLNRGGHVEVLDIAFPVQGSIDGTYLQKWSDLLLHCSNKAGKSLSNAKLHKERLEKAGFQDVVETKYLWAKHGRRETVGSWAHAALEEHISGLSMALLTRVAGWKQEEVDTLSSLVTDDIRNPEIRAYWEVYVVRGGKPGGLTGPR